jgi:VanZ family protein
MTGFAKYHLPIIVYSAVILGVSSIPDLKSPEVNLFPSDKVIHFLEYAVFALLTLRSTLRWHRALSWRPAILTALVILAVFAAVDEVVQGFVPGRHTDLLDFGADLTGGFLVLGLSYWRLRKSAHLEV